MQKRAFLAAFLLAVFLLLEGKTALALPTIAELQQSLQTEKDPQDRFHLEAKIAKLYSSQAINKNTAQDAKKHADTLLKEAEKFKKNWDYGNAVHHANLVLGRVSLLQGDLKKSAQYLQAAAKVPGSPQLKSFGPNMALAKELLQRGQKQPVLAYLDATLKFWKTEHAKKQVAAWKKSIAKGKIPDFQGNLVF